MPAPAPVAAPLPSSTSAKLADVVRAIVLGRLVGMTLGWGIRLHAALFLGVAAIILSVGWQLGPKVLLEAAEFAAFTARTDGRIVESWLAVEFNPAEMGENRRWRAFAKASPCAIVEYEGDWGAPMRRAFCGNRLGFSESYKLQGLNAMAPGIPFDWARDASGFAIPEIRVGTASARWLASPASKYDVDDRSAPHTALAQLERDVDHPVDTAVASWASPPPVFPLALDAKAPGGAMPESYVNARRSAGGTWVIAIAFLGAGFALWFAGTGLVLPALPRPVHLFLASLPVLALPWWGDVIPRYLRHLNPEVASVVADMMGDIDITGRLVAGEPEESALFGGEVLRWPVGRGAYAETFGRIRFVRPDPPPRDADAALAALAAAATRQVQAMADGERAALFHSLELDKWAQRRGAGLAFLPAAKAAAIDPRSSAEVRRAAGDFLSAWVTQPVEEPWPRDAGFQERIRMYRALADVPISNVAILSASIAERAASRK